MEILGLHHVNLNVHSLEDSLAFYVDGLGCSEISRPGRTIDGAWLRIGAHEVHLRVRPDAVIDRNQHFALTATNLDECRRHLDAKGISYRVAPEIAGVNRQIFLHDPSGNRIELNLVTH